MDCDNQFDETESYRRQRQAELNSQAVVKERLEQQYGKVWSTSDLVQDFEVKGFLAPFVVVRRKSDGKIGSLEFQHSPRFYFNWKGDKR